LNGSSPPASGHPAIGARARVILLSAGSGSARERVARYLASMGLTEEALSRALGALPSPVTRDLPSAKATAVAEYLRNLGCDVRLEAVAAPPPAAPVLAEPASRSRLVPGFALSILLTLFLVLAWSLLGRQANPPSPRDAAEADQGDARARDVLEGLAQLERRALGAAGDLAVSPGPRLAAPTFGSEPEGVADPKAHALNQEGVTLFEEGNLDGALDRFERSHHLAPDNATITKNLSDLRTYLGWKAIHAKDFDGAIAYFQRALEAEDRNVEALKGSGYAHLQLKETSAAIRDLERAQALAPGDRDLGVALARLYYQADDLDQAKKVLSTLLAHRPGDAEARKLFGKMEHDQSVEGRFQSNDTGHFRLKFDGAENGAVGALVSAVLEEAYSQIGADFHYYPPDPVVVILYTRDEFRTVSGSPDWSRGVYDGKIRIPVGGVNERSGELEDVIFHEYTHVIVNQITRGRCPTWLNEGLAQYQEPSTDGGKNGLLSALRARGVVPMAALEGSFLRLPEGQAQIAYAQGYAAVLYIAETYSFYHVRQILDRIGAGESAEQALKSVLHFGYEDLQAGITEYLRRAG
jgi:tetratricopeptide (TPR) repeat protein